MKTLSALALLCPLTLAALPAAAQVEIEWVTVGNAGNAADPLTGFGSVSYEYRIGKYEITNAQYAAFLNAVARSDPNGLWAGSMGSDPRGGITRSGTDGSYTYSVRPNMGNKPVNFVSWYDAARMSNWLTNGQGSGDTETGVYTLSGPNSISGITRDLRDANQVFIPTEDEWYKAAYHQPFTQGGDTDDYWLFATISNSVPTIATATVIGDVANPGANVANYNSGADWNGQDGNVTTVGSAGSTSFYSAFDMNGNVWEWNETLIGTSRGLRGGMFSDFEFFLRSSFRFEFDPSFEFIDGGFRLASPLPGPCTGDIADDFGTLGADGQVSFGDFLSLLGLIGPCPGGTPGCIGDIADDFGSPCRDGQVSFGDFLALLGLIGPCP
jgi:formylglycine-generating enzyme